MLTHNYATLTRNGALMFKSSRALRRAGAAVVVVVAGGLAGPLAAATQAAAQPTATVAVFQARNTNERLIATKNPNFNLSLVKTGPFVGSEATWDLSTSSDGISVIAKNRRTGHCLDTNNGGSSGLVAGRPCDGTLSQRWNLDFVSGGFKLIRNGYTGKFLTKQAGSSSLSLGNLTGSTTQHWVKTP
ncbi:RICIN domain-containing protein [Kribbella sp. NPDC051770]|uniref:RICIN domain-containing protein n=1 Tax=Kribbella sp. NPDC051770 TaxID=3155413 RepID=UPI003431C2A4